MTFVSYAQNFEDVLLWRALKSVERGFYIDVGACHPNHDSVTRAFYDRGWRGINVEPSEAGFRLMQAARPDDVNLRLALAASPGTATFYAIEGPYAGISTLDALAIPAYAAKGLVARPTQVEVATLATVCRQHAPPDVHFLKIDVEGAERAVLEGADFAAFRPWIVLLEATEPMSQVPSHEAWEALLLAAAYRFVWFDGLNRYYVPEERHAALAPSFAVPPNVFDDFVRAIDTEWATQNGPRQTDAARAATAELRAQMAEERAAAGNLRLLRTTIEATRLESRTAAQAAELALQSRRADLAEHRARDATAWLDAVRGSTSWRITRPMRAAIRIASGIAGKAPPASPPLSPPLSPLPATALAPPSVPQALATRPIGAVHQFHSGSAYGDAITNAMLLTRTLLRRLGYESRIYVQHRQPGHDATLHHIDDLPDGDAYVLIVRHSMGHDALGRILALPAPKILVYHNITPPELLEGQPFLQSYARLGRQQLALLRPAVAAALADSEYNAMELLRSGFAPVTVCPLLFDVDALQARAAAAPRTPDDMFTILFVGRVAASKGQKELVAAFAQFRLLYGRSCRLMLVGRWAETDPYAVELFELLRTLALADGQVEITGLVTDAELDAHYATADLYVSASLHEGFGVPLIEAMARGVPVLAAAAGAVPYTVGDAAVLTGDAAPAALAAQMLALANDPALRSATVARARAHLDRFRLAHHVPALLAALVRAGAEPAANLSMRAALAANMRFTLAGHVGGTYSLAGVNRTLALALEAARPGAVRLIPVEGDVATEVAAIPRAERQRILALLARPAPLTSPEIVITQHYPVWVPPQPGDLALAHFFWEETLIPEPTVATLNQGFAGVLAPSRSVAKALVDSGVTIPVRVLPQAPNLEAFHQLRHDRTERPPGRTHAFLHVSSCFPRKGVDLLLAAWARAFRSTDPVRLVIKGFPNPHNTVATDLAALQAADPGMAAIELIDRDLDPDALLDLYRRADTMVLPTRGEGYNLPAAEALAAGLSLIVTGWGGHMDLVRQAPPQSVRLLAHTLAPSASHLATPFSLWAEPDLDDLVAALREARTVPPHPWSVPPPDLAGPLADFAAERLLAPPPRPLAVAWVTTWDVHCGVAEYARQLLSAIPAPATIFADRRSTPSTPGGPTAVHPLWVAGDPATLPALESAILRADPAILVVQHQPGLMTWTMLASLLSSPALSARVVCATLHNTTALLELEPPERATVLHALGALSRVVVHTLADVNRLASLGLAENVTLIPQGAPPPHPGPATAVTVPGPDTAVLIGCYGFFLPGKGIPELIQALAILRRRWKHARLRLVNAEYPNSASAAEIAACQEILSRLGLADAVTFETAFLDHPASMAHLAPCDLIVLPYQGTKEASSAALRGALAAGPPVAVTPLPIFDEAADAVLRLPGLTPEHIAAGIEAALAGAPARTATSAAAHAWLQQRSWTRIGQRWSGMLQGLQASRDLTP